MKNGESRRFLKKAIAFVITTAVCMGGVVIPPEYAFAEPSFKWLGTNGKAQVETGLGNETNTAGLWYFFDDHGDGGGSYVEFDKADPSGDKSKVTDEDVQKFKGVSGTITLVKGTLDYNPFIWLRFDVVGQTSSTDPKLAAADVSGWGGLSISYECDLASSLELSLGETLDQKMSYGLPGCSLKKAPAGEGNVKKIQWSDFKQPAWVSSSAEKITGPEAATKLVTIQFKIQGQPGKYHFRIAGIGSYDQELPKPGETGLTTHTVTFDTNGGSAVTAQNVANGAKAIKPEDPTKGGFTFAGWYADSTLNTPFDFNSPINAPTTIYAKWIEGVAPVTYTVSFETNGGNAIAAQNITSGGKVTKPADPVKAGSGFVGWYSDSALTTPFSFDTAITADTIIYAKWGAKATVSLSENKLSLRMGESKKLEAVVTPYDAPDQSLSWNSADVTVAKVEGNGKIGTVTGVKAGETTITVRNGEEKAECKVVVERKSVGDDEFTTRISDVDLDKYVMPKIRTVSVNFSAKRSKTETVDGTVTYRCLDAVSYNGKKITPDLLKADNVELMDLSGVLKAAGISEGVKAEDVLKVKYSSSKNKNAGEASFYAKLSVKKEAKNQLDKSGIAALKKVAGAANKKLKSKANRVKYTINPASLADMSSVELVAKTNKSGGFFIKNGALMKIKAVTAKYKATDSKPVKIPAKMYFTSDAKEDGTVKVNGKKNYTGCVTVKAKTG